MSRPSRNTDRQLLDAGRKLILSHGMSGLSLRQVAEMAKVNLGMFHYHFKTKDQFVRALLTEIYEEMLTLLKEEFEAHGKDPDPLSRFKGLLTVLGQMAIANRDIWGALVKEVLSGDMTVIDFVKQNFPRHVELLAETLVACQMKGKIRKDLSPPQVLIICASVLNAPVIFGNALGKAVGASRSFNAELLSSDFLESRIELLLRGLKP